MSAAAETGSWCTTTLGEVIELKRGYDLPRRDRIRGLFPLVSSSGVTDSHAEAKVKGPGVVTGRYGTLGEVFYVEEDFWPLNTTLYVRDFKGNDPRFISYFLRTLDFFAYSDKAAVPGLNRNHLHQEVVRVPPLDEQRAIAHVLGTLDDKIELNRRMNETLEGMARALFRTWIVDFEPVRAKMEGRWRPGESLPGLPAHLHPLFPDRLVPSELGDIPEGWDVGTLGEFFRLAIGGVWGKSEPDERARNSVRCLRGIDCHALAEGRVPEAPSRWLSTRQLEKRRITTGTILIEGSGSFCGRSLLWREEYSSFFDTTVGYSNFVKRLDPKCLPSQAAVCWWFLREAFQEGEVQNFRTGTAFPNLDVKGILASFVVALPPGPIADAFAELGGLGPSVEDMQETLTLVALRDTLLPRLVSGELRVGSKGRAA